MLEIIENEEKKLLKRIDAKLDAVLEHSVSQTEALGELNDTVSQQHRLFQSLFIAMNNKGTKENVAWIASGATIVAFFLWICTRV